MVRRKAEVYIASLLLLGAVLLCLFAERKAQTELSFRAGSETIHVWENEDGDSFVFLPSYVNLNNLKIQTTKPRMLDDLTLTNGMNCGQLELDRGYSLEDGGSLTFLQSENLPALYLDTSSGSMDYIHQNKENREAGALRLYEADGRLNAAGMVRELKARGNSTFNHRKKPYSLTLSKKADLLGMGASQNWILLANTLDASHLKNKFAYDFAAEAGLPYSPDSRFVDLYLNGEYAGLYLLTERNELAPHRIEAENGFLVSKEQLYNLEENGDPYFETQAGAYLRVRQNMLTDAQMQRIFQQAENAMLTPDGRDPQTGKFFTELIDLDSWAGKYIVEELFDGVDSAIASQYFFYDGSKIFAGPVWDYDETMGAGIWLGGELMMEQVPEIFYAHRSKESPWYHSLYYNETFFDRMTELYRQVYAPLLETYIRERLPEYQDHIRQSARLNQIRWDVGESAEETERIRWYLTERMEFLTQAWAEDSEYLEVHVDYSYEDFICTYAIFDYAVLPGDVLPQLPKIPWHSWYYAGTDTPFDPDRPIWEETAVELREIDE